MKKIVIVKWRIREPETTRILQLLTELVTASREEPGTASFTIYQSENDPNELILHEEYIDSSAAEAHKQMEHYQRIVVKQIIPHLALREVMTVKKLL